MSARMRMRLTLATAVAFLLCSLATMELPELVNLVDDPSNDFSLVMFAKDAPSAVKVRICLLPQGRRASPGPQHRFAITSISTNRPLIRPFQTSDGMLHLFCTQRT
jgi:hypothetical protein